MKTFDYDELMAIQEACVSNKAESTKEVLEWLDSIGVEREAFARLTVTVSNAGLILAEAAQQAGIPAGEFLSAIYAAGFEFGVRVQQARELVV